MRPHACRRSLAALAVLALSACVKHAIPVVLGLPRPPYRQATAEEVLAAYDTWARGLTSLSASGHLTVSDLRAGQARDVGVRVVTRREGKLYLKATVAVVTALEAVSDGQTFWFTLPSKKTVWTGPALSARTADEVTDADAPYKALRPRDVTQALLPEPLDPGPDDAVGFESSPTAFTLTLARPAGTRPVVVRRVALDRATLALAEIWTFDEHGELQSDTRFSDWQGGAARRLVLRRPAAGYEAAFTFDSLQPNATVPDRAFAPRLAPDYTVKTVD